DHGIISHRTPPYTSQHNGVSERRNRTLLDKVRSMISQTTLPKSFWDYAPETVACILNRVPTKNVGKTPYEVWHGQSPRSIKCIFIGYPKKTMGYSFYYPPENKVLFARNAKFLDNSLITQEASGRLEDLEIIQDKDTYPSIDTSLNHEEDDLEIDKPQSDIIPIRRSTRTRHLTDCMCLYINAEEHELGDLGEPANYKAVLLDPGIDYGETFSLVADIRAIRILIVIAAYFDYEIWQMKVKIDFLNGYLLEEVYMEQPGGFVNLKYPNQTGYMFILNGGVVDWQNAKQSIFATSFAKAEYIATFDASKEVVWVRKFISGLGITKRARHFHAKVHYLREVIEYGDVKLEKVHTDDNLADPFTKALEFPKHLEHTRNIGMLPASSLMQIYVY
nr:hypothetical protein [Tanacetum cinerariifolium]